MRIKLVRESATYCHQVFMDDELFKCVISDGIKTNFSANRFKFRLLDMVREWPEELIDINVLDGLSYKIEMIKGKSQKKYLFKNKFPQDIFKLELLLNEIILAEIE